MTTARCHSAATAAAVAACALLMLAPATGAAQTGQTCESWEGGFVYDAKLSVAGNAPLAVIRVIDPEKLLAVPTDNPAAVHTLPLLASGFELASAPASHLLVTTNDLKGAVSGLRLASDGSPRGAAFTIYPAGAKDRVIRRVLFDGLDFVVVVDTGSSTAQELWLQRVGTDGVVAGDAMALVVAEDALLLPGPASGMIWVLEDRNESLPGRVVARLRAADGAFGGAIDVGTGRVRGSALAANGDLLVVRKADGASEELVTSIVAGAGTISTAVPFAAPGSAALTGYWLVAARPAGGFMAATSMGTVLAGMALDASGTPSSAPAAWTSGMNARLAGDRLVFIDRVEAGDTATSHASAIAFDAAGAPGAPAVLTELRQTRRMYACSKGGCSVASPAPGEAGRASVLLIWGLAVITAVVVRRRAGPRTELRRD